MNLDDVGAAFTCCLFPEFTTRALLSVLGYYSDLEAVVVYDGCPARGTAMGQAALELEETARLLGVPILRNDERIGTGRSLDRGLRALTRPLFLTVDHGVVLRKSGIVEVLLERMTGAEIGAGRNRNDKRCNKAFGPYIDPVFALWDREFILAHPDLSFKLTHIRIGAWQVDGCSTAQLLQYRAMRLGKALAFVRLGLFESYIRHHHTPHTRGQCASPHELVEVDEDYLIPRRRRKDGTLAYQGEHRR